MSREEFGNSGELCAYCHEPIMEICGCGGKNLKFKAIIKQMADQMTELTIAAEALEKLARLGNAPMLGNSDGNRIAQDALRDIEEIGDLECVLVRRDDVFLILNDWLDDKWSILPESREAVLRLKAALNLSPTHRPFLSITYLIALVKCYFGRGGVGERTGG